MLFTFGKVHFKQPLKVLLLVPGSRLYLHWCKVGELEENGGLYLCVYSHVNKVDELELEEKAVLLIMIGTMDGYIHTCVLTLVELNQ